MSQVGMRVNKSLGAPQFRADFLIGLPFAVPDDFAQPLVGQRVGIDCKQRVEVALASAAALGCKSMFTSVKSPG